jgi:hypothetical protein
MTEEEFWLDVEDDIDVGVPGDGPGSEGQLLPVVQLEWIEWISFGRNLWAKPY